MRVVVCEACARTLRNPSGIKKRVFLFDPYPILTCLGVPWEQMENRVRIMISPVQSPPEAAMAKAYPTVHLGSKNEMLGA
jgi:hypothetical protein